MKTKKENLKRDIQCREERKLSIEKIISQLETREGELSPEDRKNLGIIKELLRIENKLLEKERHYKKTIGQNEAMIARLQKLNDNLDRLNKISTTEVYEEISLFMDTLITKYRL